MNTIASFYKSSVGRKMLMALSGLFLCSFLVVHLSINLFALKNDAGRSFDAYAEFMATYPFLRPLEIVLFLGFILHAVYGVWVWYTNKLARPHRYAVNKAADVSKLESRVMFITAIVVAVFLVIHINTFFVTSRFIDSSIPMYERLKTAFANPWYVAFYVVAIGFLAFHLKHGFQSAFQTLGVRVQPYELLIDIIAVVFWLVIPVAFISIPLYFLWAH